MRFQEWVKTDNYINSFNSDFYSLQHNQFSDWTQSERNAILDEKFDQTQQYQNVASQSSKLQSRTYSPYKIEDTASPVMKQTPSVIVSSTSCPQNCTTCNIACTACQSTFTLQSTGKCSCNTGQVLTAAGQCANAITCTIGFTNVQNKCVACPKFCFACTNIGGVCTQCSIATMKIVNVTDSNPCLNCDPQFQTVAVGQCRCQPNTFLNGTVCSPLSTCPLSNQFNTGSTQVCQNCSAGCATCNNFSGWCIRTTDPSVLINSTTGVPYCPSGQILLNQKCEALILCPVSQYNDGLNNCYNCPTNCSSCTNVTGKCTQCAPTYTLNSVSNTCGCLASTQFLDLGTSTNTGNCVTLVNCGTSKYNPGYNNCTDCSFGCSVCPMGVCNTCLSTFTQSGTTCACNPDTSVQFYNSATNQCVNITPCPSGQYNGGTNNCLNCPQNCSACAFRTGLCSSCVSTFTFNSSQKTCSCIAGLYWTSNSIGGTCQTCPATCVNCQDLTGSCTSCPSNLVLVTQNSPVTCGCSIGTYLKSGSCVACPNNCTACSDGTGACTACSNTYALSSGVCTCTGSQGVISGLCADLIACPDGQYNNGQQQCVNGPANCLKVTPVSGICSQCQPTFTFFASVNMCSCVSPGQFLNSSNQCQACPQNCTRCSPSTGAQAACTVCQPTFTFTQATWSCACLLTPTQQAFVNSNSCAAMITCPSAQYNDGTNTCKKCSTITPNCGVCSVNTGVCTSCLDTFYSNTTSGALACECLPGQYLNTKGACAVCPLNCTACEDLTGKCTSCADTFTLANGVCSCVETSQLLLSDVCVDYAVCTSTQYPNNQNLCTDCAQYCTTCSNVTGNCLTCQPGYVTTAKKICEAFVNCGAGKYNDGHNVCINCPAAFCTACADITGSCTSCNTIPLVNEQCVCSVGQYRATGSTCEPCRTNCTSCADTTGYCTTCNTTFSNNVGGTGLCGCDITKGQAYNGTFCDTLRTCANGYYNPNDGTNTCKKCPSANCARCNSNGNCTNCNATFIFNTAVTTDAANACICPTSFYKMLSGLCNRCPANCSACADTTGSCSTCSDTTFGAPVSGACVCPSSTPAFTGGKCYAMTDCGAGKWNDGTNTCQNCPNNCASCSDWTGICSQCSTSYTLNSGDNTCTCLSTQYLSSTTSQCTNCPTNCTTCSDGAGLCLTCDTTFSPPASGVCLCPAGLAYENSQCVAMTQCQPGQYNDGTNTCQACPLNCQNCSDWTGLCTTCNSTFLAPTAGNTCGCAAGYYATSQNVCAKCSAHCQTCTDISGECTQCSDSSFTIVAGFCVCSPSQYLTSTNICQTCPTNCTSCQDLTGICASCVSTFEIDSRGGCSCQGSTKALVAGGCVAMTSCAAQQFNDGTNTCTQCPSNCQTCDDFTGVCTQCTDTYTNNNPTTNSCTCTTSQYLDSTPKCVSCPANCSTCADTTGYCNGCKATFNLASNACGCDPTNQALVTTDGVQQCVALATCPSAQYNPGNNVCQQCPTNCAACSAYLGVCSQCLATFTRQLDTSCICGSNQFKNTTGFCQNCNSNCTTCTDLTGACTACAASFVGPTAGACTCESGQIPIRATGLCTAKISCPTGQYNDGQNNCVNCSSNCTACNDFTGNCSACVQTFTINSNTTQRSCSCASSQAIVRNLTTGVTSCQSQIKCKTGQYNPGTNICQQCPRNCSTCLDGAGFCTACLTGFTPDIPKKGSCGCKSNQAFVNGMCTAQIACTGAGQFNPGNNVCQKCPQNCTACQTPSGLCTSCASTFTITMSRGTCTCTSTQAFVGGKCTTLNSCAAGQYNPGNNVCTPCSSQCASCQSFTGRCTQCNVGYSVSSGGCVASRRILKNETSCVYAVGPVGQAQICLAQAASETRVVPEFSLNDQNVDWRSWDVVTDVKDLGKCVGDFASSASAAAASAYAIKTGKLFYLSEQYLIDCDVGSFGCQGGNKTSSSLLLATKGAVLQDVYPYVGKQTGCRGDSVQKVFQLQYPGSQQIIQTKEAFKTQLRKSPINISFRISGLSFFFYGNGILTKDACETGKLNHAMLAVGFGVENNVEYALIQNSWGKSWGEQGLFRVELSDDAEGPCGLYLQSFYILV